MGYEFPRCQATPTSDHQVSVTVDGKELTRWHYGSEYPRPFFYPIVGPSGHCLTRMGHPGAPDHEHHRSVWFAHNVVAGVNFWADTTPAVIRQQQWLCYEDTDEAARLAVELRWYDGHDPRELLTQEAIAEVRPLEDGEWLLEVQSRFTPTSPTLTLEKTNFGVFAVRVAKNLSARFGGGQLTGADGKEGEPSLFGQPNPWMDYSGPVPGGATEGITYFDHPSNVSYPSKWHVRQDGWMGASLCRDTDVVIRQEAPLVVRYLLHIHRGGADNARSEKIAADFAASPAFELVKAPVSHTRWGVRRVG